MTFYREWLAPPPAIVPLTPIDRSKPRAAMEEGGEADQGRKRRRDLSNSDDGPPPIAHTMSINGRRILLCNFNNVVFQVLRSVSASYSTE